MLKKKDFAVICQFLSHFEPNLSRSRFDAKIVMKHCAPITLKSIFQKYCLQKPRNFMNFYFVTKEIFVFFEKLSDLNVETAYPREIKKMKF